MTNDEMQQLKALAEAATPGPWECDEALTPWRIASGEVVGGDGTGVSVVFTGYDWHVKVGEEPDTGSAIYESIGEPATIVEGARNADATFMAAANPKAVLALIAKVESLAADAERYRWLREPTSDVALVLDKRTDWVPEDETLPGVGGYYVYEYRAGEELDAAIDMAKEKT